jgi:hypothetical protein
MVEAEISSFRGRVENVLKIVTDGAGAMQSTAVGLFGS